MAKLSLSSPLAINSNLQVLTPTVPVQVITPTVPTQVLTPTVPATTTAQQTGNTPIISQANQLGSSVLTQADTPVLQASDINDNIKAALNSSVSSSTTTTPTTTPTTTTDKKFYQQTWFWLAIGGVAVIALSYFLFFRKKAPLKRR